jgi:hypothetical protein
MVGVTRVNLLYSTIIRTKKDREEGRPGVSRPGLLGVAKSAFYESYVLKDEGDPFIPDTDVPRLKLLHLAKNATAVFNDEIEKMQEGLRRWRDKTFAEGLPRKQIGKPKKTVKPVTTTLRKSVVKTPAEHTA